MSMYHGHQSQALERPNSLNSCFSSTSNRCFAQVVSAISIINKSKKQAAGVARQVEALEKRAWKLADQSIEKIASASGP